ncbi:oligopeptide transport system permease protein [Litorivivens lipolytica]|uniref:Oligopeptide transport system permease protein n=1 Tax=Litorivivens lipolytica TaxID=1524264 RepID=A0A7W4Z513_9GAMM|nr:ABC transporter permease subunit [Litorivivens lipolytica]MBB3046713.1 oligopeptide transport system permease protein [Litorivivens lipolytica]
MAYLPADFDRLPPQAPEAAETLAPSPPLWQLLLQDMRACLAAGVVLLVLVMAFIGPWLWPQDPATQWLSQVSSGPSAARRVDVVSDEFWHGPRQNVSALTALQATTTQVKLAWPDRADAMSYRVYRNAGGVGLGMPLIETVKTHYADRLQLSEQRYRYSVVAVRADGSTSDPEWIEVKPELTLGTFEAQLLGLDVMDGKVSLPSHPLGTDALGRDMLSRILHGAQTSMLVGLSAPLLFITLGAFYGALAGLLGGWVDNVLMRIADFVVALPFLLFMILFRVALGIESGESGLFPMVMAMVLLSWPSAARLVRGQVLQLRESAFVMSARLAGAGNFYLIRRHLLPNVLPLLLVSLSFAIPQAIFTEALLSFIGMGVVPPTPSWGTLCNEGIRSMLTHPHELIIPALAISITVLSFNVLGDALRDAMDVKVRRSLR